jgi:hypothetical protein
MSNLGVICFAHHTLHHHGKLEILGKAGTLTFRRILDHEDGLEDLGEYVMNDGCEVDDDSDSVPRGTDDYVDNAAVIS